MYSKLIYLVGIALFFNACGTERLSHDAPSPVGESARDGSNPEVSELRSTVKTLKARVDSLETRLADKQKVQKEPQVFAAKDPDKATSVAVTPQASDQAGTPIEAKAPPIARDIQPGYVSDSAVLAYRQSLILLQAQKYPESALAFSAFLENYPDHALAGSAQFFVGECFFHQQNYKRAVAEYRRVLTSYDRSPHVSDALHQLALSEAQLGNTEESFKQRQLLTRLFPQSPAASESSSAPMPVIPKPEDSAVPVSPRSGGIDEPPATVPMGGGN
jgi:tol-pal system protein YbgF